MDGVPVAPAALTITQGWTDKNKELFEEWGQYYIKLVHKSDTLSEEDVAELRAIEERQIDGRHTSLERQKALLEEFKNTPMPRPEAAPKDKESHRHNPIDRVGDSK